MHPFERTFRFFISILILSPISLVICSIHIVLILVLFNTVTVIYLTIIDIFNIINISLQGRQYNPRGLGISVRNIYNDAFRFLRNAGSIPRRFVETEVNQENPSRGLGIPLETIKQFKIPAIICTVLVFGGLTFMIRSLYKSPNYFTSLFLENENQSFSSTPISLNLEESTTIFDDKKSRGNMGTIVVWSRKPIKHKTKVFIDKKFAGYLSKHSKEQQDCDSKIAVKKKVSPGEHDIEIHQFSIRNQKWYRTATSKVLLDKGKCNALSPTFGHIPNEPE